MGWFAKKAPARKVFPPPAEVTATVSPSVWAVSLNLVARIPGSLPEGSYVYQVVAIFEDGESSPQITHPVTTHIDGSAVVLRIQRGGSWDAPRPLRYRIMREKAVIAEVVAAMDGENDLFTDYLDTGEDLSKDGK